MRDFMMRKSVKKEYIWIPNCQFENTFDFEDFLVSTLFVLDGGGRGGTANNQLVYSGG